MTSIIKNIDPKDEVLVSNIKITLVFDGEHIATENTKTVGGIIKQIDQWKRLYALKRWADRCNIDITFYVDKVEKVA